MSARVEPPAECARVVALIRERVRRERVEADPINPLFFLLGETTSEEWRAIQNERFAFANWWRDRWDAGEIAEAVEALWPTEGR